jgi:cyclase
MLKNRIIPCLDIKDGRTVKGIQFKGLRDAGDPVELAKKYADQGADELVFLDISATLEKRKTLYELVEKIARQIHIPFTVGGGISSVEDVDVLLNSGADKVSVNSAAIYNRSLVTAIANRFGEQCTVVAIDVKKIDNQWMVFSKGGTTATPYSAQEWAQQVTKLGAGELLITSMNNDGGKDGYALDLYQLLQEKVTVPIIASGGAGSCADFYELFKNTKVTAGLAASIFHDEIIPLPQLKTYLTSKNIPIR